MVAIRKRNNADEAAIAPVNGESLEQHIVQMRQEVGDIVRQILSQQENMAIIDEIIVENMRQCLPLLLEHQGAKGQLLELEKALQEELKSDAGEKQGDATKDAEDKAAKKAEKPKQAAIDPDAPVIDEDDQEMINPFLNLATAKKEPEAEEEDDDTAVKSAKGADADDEVNAGGIGYMILHIDEAIERANIWQVVIAACLLLIITAGGGYLAFSTIAASQKDKGGVQDMMPAAPAQAPSAEISPPPAQAANAEQPASEASGEVTSTAPPAAMTLSPAPEYLNPEAPQAPIKAEAEPPQQPSGQAAAEHPQ